MKTKRFWVTGTIVTLLLAGVVSLFASASPDGLESVLLTGCDTADGEITGGACVLQAAGDHEIGGAFADYGVSFLDNEILGASLAGILGVLLTLAVATGLFWLLARGKRTQEEA
ncbi:PDGLE domain-containing protein [Glycomyces algeriensis]|uniref:Membrane protein n=1 Tax=Glycomyces algeriensis TaxID=256037 RepID=A0A9W6LFA1_9ACTN|nr:PDGLE domain-containing protein [Glycomyces algeriensis]MDA1366929.1 PDGLE domain-containing protein [Glycomyces algeriensis]MDR7352685.1 cobalt/nickel transport protein [Glycomyces algeriensis]GLI40366.1 membrane protein [Glycomyces algeriensis]